jgi:hypothetical protein
VGNTTVEGRGRTVGMNRHGRMVAEIVAMVREGYRKATRVEGLRERGVRATRLL